MRASSEYWVWLSTALGVGYNADELIHFYGDAKNVFDAGYHQWILSGLVRKTAAERMKNYSLDEAKKTVALCEENGWEIVTPDSEYYPYLLHEIHAKPLVLYVNGDVSVLKHPLPIAFVGTRDASANGIKIAEEYAYSLAKAGALIVSGGALGIDSAAHMGALQAVADTIAFLGCGFLSDYLKSNKNLRDAISRHGACVSEFHPTAPANRGTFPIRNRLIAGISRATVVVEAGLRSGSLITARYAMEENRDVFAFPGEVTSFNHLGTNKLIADGAYCVISKESILNVYAHEYPDLINLDSLNDEYDPTMKIPPPEKPKKVEVRVKPKTPEKEPFDTSLLSDDNSVRVYGFLADTPKSVDEIVIESGMDATDVLVALTDIEICGGAKTLAGKRYIKA